MEDNNEKYFTIWYGVYHLPTRTLTYASGGQHAALLVPKRGSGWRLQTEGLAIGIAPDLKYPSARVEVPPGSEIYLFSDGVYEIARPDGSWLSWEEFSQFVQENQPSVDAIAQRMREFHGVQEFEDDFSLLKLKFT
jgi:sigma-B regulation protein RsbU (phosphoserine phosphatase)